VEVKQFVFAGHIASVVAIIGHHRNFKKRQRPLTNTPHSGMIEVRLT
jgi:hypothetical protein